MSVFGAKLTWILVHSKNLVHGDLTGVSTTATSSWKQLLTWFRTTFLSMRMVPPSWLTMEFSIFVTSSMACHISEAMRDGPHLKNLKSRKMTSQEACLNWHQTSILSGASCCRFVGDLNTMQCDYYSLCRSSQEKFRIRNFAATNKLPCRYSKVGNQLNQWLCPLQTPYGTSCRSAGLISRNIGLQLRKSLYLYARSWTTRGRLITL